MNEALVRIDATDLRHQHRGVLLPAQDVTNRPRHIGGRERRGGDLIEERLEAVVVLLVDQNDIERRAGERFRRIKSPETGADNHDFRTLRRHVRLPRWLTLFRPSQFHARLARLRSLAIFPTGL